MISLTAAQQIAEHAFVWLANDSDMIGEFLEFTGADPSDLRQFAPQEGFHLSVLDFITQSDNRVLAFAQSEGLAPEHVAHAAALLTGPGGHQWTAD